VLTSICPNCHSRQTRVFYAVDAVPVNSCLVLRSAEQARAFPVGDIALSFCMHCSFVFNAAFDETLIRYQTGYEESQAYSPTFNHFEQTLIERLLRDYDLRGKTIVEIGCGKGEFLLKLCVAGNNRGIGYDPTFDPQRVSGKVPDDVRFVQAFYTDTNAVQADFYCCKMTLEHIPDTGAFIAMLRRSLGERRDCVVFFQIPDATRIIAECAFEDIYYEHCSYFTADSLRYLFEASGFDVLRIDTVFKDQYLTLEARPADMPVTQQTPLPMLSAMATQVAGFAAGVQNVFTDWERRLAGTGALAGTRRIVLWGGSSKAVAILGAPVFAGRIDYVVDINPYRQDTFLPASGVKIVAPDALLELPPDLVIVANSAYRAEISAQLQSMALFPEILTLNG